MIPVIREVPIRVTTRPAIIPEVTISSKKSQPQKIPIKGEGDRNHARPQ